ncbi:mitochondrial protein [Lentinula lateritia]|uniref:Mitochondrial protein n=1 Tax=Lentinula aff. lateritia TaxID=2804960 RepID=A0ACC1U1P1_9AGAR|nr:mitochondrial protein [Lentinula aff. lateritia]KAJ3850412.1 mitochondrial protein [Lentinula lateritia]
MSASPVRKLLVVGGNGFIGSAICRAALAKGIQVTSVSSSGRPYTTPKGHAPAWTSKVTWLKGSAHNPTTFSDVLADVHGVVHTLGTLIEDGGKYKQAIREGNVTKMIGSALGSIFGFQNPLKGSSEGSYEDINRDSALRVCQAFLSSGQGKQSPKPRPFVYISAEDVFRPIIPARYIETKREAEMGIEAMLSTSPPGQYRGVYIRPSLVYHAHYRPLTTPAAAIFDLSASLHRKIPEGIPKPSQLLHYLGAALSPQSSLSMRNAHGPSKDASLGSPLDSIANAITIPPIHVDHVAEATVIALGDSTVGGVVGVERMRELIGWWPEDQHHSTQKAI